MKTKRFIVIFSVLLAMIITFAGCGNDNAGTKGDLSSEKCLQKAISDNGYGRQKYIAGNLSFTVGSTFKDFADEGFTVSESVYNEKIEPWGFIKTYASYDSAKASYASLDIYLLNESDTAQSAYNCRVICVFGDVEIKSNGLFETGVTSKTDIAANYNADDMMSEKELTYGSVYYDASENDLAYGSSFNHIKFKFEADSNLLEGVQIVCCDNVLSEMTISDKNSLYYYSPVATASLLSPYMDSSVYLGEMAINIDSTPLNEKFNTKTLNLKLNGVDFNFGNSEETYRTLTKKGVTFLIEDDFEDIEPNSSSGTGNDDGVAKIGEKTITHIGFANYHSAQAISWKDAVIEDITIENPNGVSTNNPNAPSFNLFGVTEKSTIKDIVDTLGYPYSIEGSSESPHIAELLYAFNSDGKGMTFRISVDAINNSIYEFRIYTVTHD